MMSAILPFLFSLLFLHYLSKSNVLSSLNCFIASIVPPIHLTPLITLSKTVSEKFIKKCCSMEQNKVDPQNKRTWQICDGLAVMALPAPRRFQVQFSIWTEIFFHGLIDNRAVLASRNGYQGFSRKVKIAKTGLDLLVLKSCDLKCQGTSTSYPVA